MLSKEQKKELTNKFKEQKVSMGIFAVRCTATGQLWIGSARNLEANRNGIWFSLRIGSHRDAGLQTVWNAQGESAFEYEILERLKDDLPRLAVADLLKERKQYWLTQHNGLSLL